MKGEIVDICKFVMDNYEEKAKIEILIDIDKVNELCLGVVEIKPNQKIINRCSCSIKVGGNHGKK